MTKKAMAAPRRRRSAEEARREILDAAQRRLVEGGPEAVRLQDVAADVGISHPTVLHHFGSREGLLDALSARAISGLAEDMLGKLQSMELGTLLERAEQTFREDGFARLLAWNVLSGRTRPEDIRHDLIRQVAASELGPEASETQYREVLFRIRLAALAIFGEALIGPLLTRSAGRTDEEVAHREFVQWFAQLLATDSPRRPRS